MDSERWQRVQALFHEAAARPKTDWSRFLDSACEGDGDVKAEVLTMLQNDLDSGSMLDAGLNALAGQLAATAGANVATEFGPYRLERILGEGGMGVVWLAQRKDAGNNVAIKFLPHAALSPARRERFASEIKTLARLKHPFIARLYDAGSLPDGSPWFVMEYVEGERLSDYLASHQLTILERLALFRRICEAVQYAHGQEVIHRDLKPSNIMIEKDGTPRLLDFGIARQLQNLDSPGEQTRPGLRFLSPDYAAPEWINEGRVGLTTDVYSLGVIIYQMITGRLPFERQTTTPEPDSVVAGRFAGKPSSIVSASTKAHWKDLDTLCLKAIHADPRQRYQSVEALIRDVDHYLKDEPLEATPDSFGYHAIKFIRRNRRAVIAASAVFALLAAQLIFFTIRLTRARDAAVAEARRTQRIQRFMLNLVGAGDQKAGPSNELRVTELLDRGAQQASMLNADPETQAELYKTIGTMYEMLGKYPKADRMLEAAANRMKSATGTGDPKLADALVQLALLRGEEGRFTDAEQLARQGVAIVSAELPENAPAAVNAKWALGQVLDESGQYEKALAVLDPLVKAQASGEESSVTLADSDTAFAYANNSLGRYDTAASYFGRALTLDRQLFGAAHPRVAFDLANVGTARILVGRTQDAETNYKQALSIMNAWYGPEHPETAEIATFLALAYERGGKLAEAEPLLQKVLSIEEQSKGKDHPYIAIVLDTMGKVALRRGELAAAEADFSRALSINRAALGNNRYQTAVSMENFADVLNREGRYAEAEALLRPALRVLASMPASNNDSLAIAQLSLGHALLQQRRYSEAKESLTAGYALYSKRPQRTPDRVRQAREDMLELYRALNEPEKAEALRSELSQASHKPLENSHQAAVRGAR